MVTNNLEPLIWTFEGYSLDELHRELSLHGALVPLEAKLFDLLRDLAANSPQAVTRQALCQAVWPGLEGSDVSLNTAISKLRSALGEGGKLIVTVPQVGYKLVTRASSRPAEASAAEVSKPQAGDAVPGREQWTLKKPLGATPDSAVWLCSHNKTGELRVFKFAFDGARLSRLRREVAVARLLSPAGSARSEFIRVFEWNFEAAPYFLESEYGGPNLLEWAEARGGLQNIPLPDRLQLLASAARAVSIAHNLGVIHRDLKPANVLAESSGPDLQVRVSDFDLAAVLDPFRLDLLQITNPGFGQTPAAHDSSTAGTVLYLAPELLRGQAPSLASDIYALGVMLYQLTAGDFRAKLSAGWEAEIADPLIREDIASAANGSPELRPSASELVQRLANLDRRRQEAAARELANRRLELAEQRLAIARARRPWVVVTLTLLALASLAGFLLFRRAASERDRANLEVARATALNRFVSIDILGQDNPFVNASPHESLEDAVKRASADIDREFKTDPLVAGNLHLEIARALDARTDFSAARREYGFARALFNKLEPGSPNLIRAELFQAKMEALQFASGTSDAAKFLLQLADSQIARLAHPPADLEVWRLAARGTLAISENDPKTATEDFSAALRRAELTSEVDPGSRQLLEQQLAAAYLRIPDGARAEQVVRKLIDQSTALEGPENVWTLRARVVLASSFFVQGKYRDAIREADSLYPRLAAKLGKDHDMVIKLIGTRAASEGHLGMWSRAAADDLEISEIAAKKGGPSFNSLATLSDAGLSQCRAGNYRAGEANTRSAFEQSRRFLKNVGMTGATSYAVAYCLLQQNKLAEAFSRLQGIDIEAVTHLTGESSAAGDIALAQGEVALRQRNIPAARRYAEAASRAFEHTHIDDIDRQELASFKTALARYPASR